MFCDAYNKSLTEAAVAGKELTPALQKHLSECEFCRNAFAEEKSLFAAIDSVLYTAANTEVPATLIPRVHVALNNERGPQSRGFNFLWGIGGAAVTAVVVLSLLYFPFKHQSTPVGPSPSPVATAKNSPDEPALNPAHGSGVSSLHPVIPKVVVVNSMSQQRLPEVLVPPDEGAALVRYEEILRRRQAGAVLMATAKALDLPQGIEPLQIKEIELAALNIPALSKWDSEDEAK